MSKIEDYTKLAEAIARDDSHGYDQAHRDGNPDYDCSSLVCAVVQQAGIKVKDAGASYTGNMVKAFKKCGFTDITSKVKLSSGSGLLRGDILLNEQRHVAIYCGNNKMVDARINELGKTTGGKQGDQTGHEIEIHAYRNYPWTHILRYNEDSINKSTASVTKKKNTKAIDYAQFYDKDLAKTYTVKARPTLNMRHGAGTGKGIIVEIPDGSKVVCYGFYSTYEDAKWLYVVATIDNIEYIGFVHSAYLI